MENKARKSYSKSTYDHASREDKEKKMNMGFNFIEKTTVALLLKIEITLILDGMVDVVELRQNMETPTNPSSA